MFRSTNNNNTVQSPNGKEVYCGRQAQPQQQPVQSPAPPGSKASEAERKRQIEVAAARRYASGTVFPGTSYRLDKTIGKGSYGRVKLATDLRSGERVAIKFIAKASMVKPAHWTRVRREVNLMSLACHPHVIRLEEWRETPEDVMIVMEFVTGRDLFERINERREKRYSEAEARPIFRQLVSALEYCHANRIVHRDLKPENVMVDERGNAKLIDFGFANLFHPRSTLTTNCGSPLYAAPEIVQAKPYVGPEVDIWSLGVVLYAMLVGALPFEDENLKGLYRKIGEGRFAFPEHVSPPARELVRGMLAVGVLDRLTIAQIKASPWVLDGFGFPPDSFLPPRPAALAPSQVREDILLQMRDQYGYGAPDQTRSVIAAQPDSPEFAVYCMCEERWRREAKALRAKESLDLLEYIDAASASTGTLKITPITPKYGHQGAYQPHRPQPAAYHQNDGTLDAPRYGALLDMPELVESGRASAKAPGTPGKSGMMAQAAANVVNKFKRFRDIKFGISKPI
jgi:serine/threonine protein kinase